MLQGIENNYLEVNSSYEVVIFLQLNISYIKRKTLMKNFTLPIRFGIVACAALIAYFLVLSLMGLHSNVFYSLFNGVIVGFAIYEVIKYTRIQNTNSFNYRMGFTNGLVTGFLATILFTIFFSVYTTEWNPDFLIQLSEKWASDYTNFKAIVYFTVAIMGFATTVVLTLAFMQLFKSSNSK
ncbi:hypothetical protein GCM10011414_02980 [Croceivirga lutea]|nr:hypothetical protein GCM10011414_02980 [Croceivirga lutea]